jgi:uncharacterized protein YecE (DUF72 family)
MKLPAEYRYVLEFRDASWFVAEVRDLLERLNVAHYIHDYPGLRVPHWVTRADLVYIRLHGYGALYVGSYPERVLRRWSRTISDLEEGGRDVYVYFNNDAAAAAPIGISIPGAGFAHSIHIQTIPANGSVRVWWLARSSKSLRSSQGDW